MVYKKPLCTLSQILEKTQWHIHIAFKCQNKASLLKTLTEQNFERKLSQRRRLSLFPAKQQNDENDNGDLMRNADQTQVCTA